MIDRLFDIITAIWSSLLPWIVMEPYERGVLIRLGKFEKVLEPGFHWMYPFHIDRVCHETVTPTTHHIAGLCTTTRDGQTIGFDAVITYQIADIEKAMLKVTAVKDAITDTCMGVLGTALSEAAWADIVHGKATEELTKLCRSRGWKWGIEVVSVQLAGVAIVRNFRISSNTGHADHLMNALAL